MSASANQYNPDYATSPGWILGEHLEVLDISQAELARRCGLSPKLISEIISGKARVTPKTAIQFEKELGLAAEIWLNLESNYQLHLLR
ncbi:MAG: HigA family addiction module antitoxin, partial [Alphaproteobacteria bacterium]|nr:HigA family addiction module antitoxin [Alphaproteobacteria bacterium]